MKELIVKLEWNETENCYGVHIDQIGEGIQTSGKTLNEAISNASVVISRYLFEQEKQEKKTA